MFRRKPNKPATKKKRAWEEEADADDGDGPSDAFLLLQKELEEKEIIQKENEERSKKQEAAAAEATRALVEKEEIRKANAKNPRVFLDIEIADVTGSGSRLKKGKLVGKIIFELFEDVVPRTAENFRALCTGEKPRGASGFPLCFLGNIFHRIVPQFVAQGGDITREDGSGGESIYGPTFEDENFRLKHDAPGLLSMANSGRNSNNSQFFITFAPLPWLDVKHVVFGKVIDGMEIVRQIEECGTTSGEPTKRVQIAECGQVPDEDEESDKEEQARESEEQEGGDHVRRRVKKRSRVTFSAPDSPDAPRKGSDGGEARGGSGSIASSESEFREAQGGGAGSECLR